MNNDSPWNLAQINIAQMLGTSIADPVMERFVAQLDEVNALAEAAPGFVWRLKDDANNATAFNPYNDDRIIVNMSVWRSLDDLIKFVYHGRHAAVLRDRRQWFVNFGKPFTALWYIPKGKLPSVEDAVERLNALQKNGPSPFAFDFKKRFASPDDTTSEELRN